MTSRRPPDCSVKMPKGIRNTPIRTTLRLGAMLGTGRKSIYASRNIVVEAPVPGAFVEQLLPTGVQSGVLLVRLILCISIRVCHLGIYSLIFPYMSTSD